MHGHGNIFSNLVMADVDTVITQLPRDDDSHTEAL